ncbi:Wadjet anti-phage system protein JetD domain-containing protein [Gordonia aquimaris]|uniref:DUF2220 family protein n=1 Tax=Gordonia aquimaris TaxID=2984863 RepID=A0A9X3DA26_9ACTN|nr:DUF3322 and DUF2220 domain-containing protein [Gordonia aquimaris]MCX2966829.1 DUF2220 family protein [Gordonia aquimaris]
MSRRWTTPDDIAAKVRRRWDDGSLLRSHANREPFDPIVIALRGPTASEIGADLGSARDWVTALDTGRRDDRRYALQWQSVGGRHVGRNQLPARAVVSSFEQAWTALGVTATVRRYDELLDLAAEHPAVRTWMIRYPLRALELADEMPRLIAAHAWLDEHRSSHRYLREISAPGVDTKFAERHRAVLAAMLGVSTSASGFLADLGLHGKPEFVRLRFAASVGLPAPLTELTARADELARLELRPRSALVIENEITYLSVDVPDDGVVLWGKGFEVDRIGRLPWLADTPIRYWGDLDTHGFAILDRMRAWLPQTESVLMDRETLLSHRDRWVTEQRPASSDLTHLTRGEHELYTDLVTDALGERVRLEQERIDWSWVRRCLSAAG